MASLKSQLSDHGFTSQESYDHAITCYLNSDTTSVRCLHIDGVCGRRRSAFAHALAYALDATQVLYYEFGKDKAVPQIIRMLQDGEEVVEEPPVEALDRVLTEACAQSEAEQTVLILDQLHLTQFINHIRLYEFLQTGLWRYSDVQYQANLLNLKVFVISNEPLYHSLQGASFRLWVYDTNELLSHVGVADLGLHEEDEGWFSALQRLFEVLHLSPTLDEYRYLIHDIEQRVHDKEQLKISLFGWLESVDKKKLDSTECRVYLDDIVAAIVLGRGVDEEIEISSVVDQNKEK